MNRYGSLISAIIVALISAGAATAGDAAGPSSPAAQAPLKLVPRPVDSAPQRRAHPQPALPANTREIPYRETSPEPVLTEAEKQRGYLLFARPTVEPVYPNTRPRPDERTEALVAFAAGGQFEPVTLALYPVRPPGESEGPRLAADVLVGW